MCGIEQRMNANGVVIERTASANGDDTVRAGSANGAASYQPGATPQVCVHSFHQGPTARPIPATMRPGANRLAAGMGRAFSPRFGFDGLSWGVAPGWYGGAPLVLGNAAGARPRTNHRRQRGGDSGGVMMANEWRTGKLGELVAFKTGKLDSNAAVPDGDYPFFTCSQETLRTNTFSFDTECVLLAGNNANGIYPLKYFNGKFDAYQRTYVVKPRDTKVLTTKFLYYALRPKLSELRSFSTGAATKFLTLTILNETEIQVPPLPVQRRIAGILSAYDELMENSQRRIRLLEAMARALYREWFVHFRFPGHDGNSSPSGRGKGEGRTQFVTSPLGDIPQGWEVKKLADVAEVNRAQTAARTRS